MKSIVIYLGTVNLLPDSEFVNIYRKEVNRLIEEDRQRELEALKKLHNNPVYWVGR